MARDVIAAPEDRAFLLVATDDDGEVVGFALNQWKWSSLRGARVGGDGRPVRRRVARAARATPTR